MNKGKVRFAKVSASGNDFIVIDNRKGLFSGDEKDFFRTICRRRFSVGADGVILFEKKDGIVWVKFINPDGEEAGMCGNGGRAVSRYLVFKNIVRKSSFEMKAKDGIHKVVVNGDRIRFQINVSDPGIRQMAVEIDEELYNGFLLNTGVSHFILFEKDIRKINVRETGKAVRELPVFLPSGTNVNFVQIINKNEALIRTFEKGVEDETYACGTGAVASVIAGVSQGFFTYPVDMIFKGGMLQIIKENNEFFIEGKVIISYFGEIDY